MGQDHPAGTAVETELDGHANNNTAAPAELDKVRSILFGEHLRAFETRMERLENRLSSELDSVRKEIAQQVSDLRKSLNDQHSDWQTALAKESERGSRAFDELRSQAENNRQAAAGASAELEALLGDREQFITQRLDESCNAIRNEIAAARDGLAQEMGSVASELRTTKTDRSALAEMFAALSRELQGSSDRK